MNKKKHLLSVAALAGIALVVAGCSSTSAESETTTITWAWQAGDNTTIDAVVTQFESENPGVKVKLLKSADGDLQNTVRTQFLAGTGPDVTIIWPGTEGLLAVQDIAKEGLLAPLDDIPWASEASEGALAAGTVDGKLYMATPGSGSTGAIYNLDTLAEVGLEIPETWTELLQFCEDAKAEGKTAFGLGLQNGWTSRLIPLSFLANEIPDVNAWNASLADGSFDYTKSPEWQTALEKEQAMNDAGCFNESPAGTDTDTVVLPGVINGDFLGVVSVSAHIGVMEMQAPSEINLTIAPLPSTDDAADSRFQLTYSNGIGVNANSKHLDLAKKLVATFTEVANLNSYAAGFAILPSITNDEFEVPAPLTETAAFVADGRTAAGEWIPGADTFTAMVNGIQGQYLGISTIDDTLTSMQTAYEAFMAE